MLVTESTMSRISLVDFVNHNVTEYLSWMSNARGVAFDNIERKVYWASFDDSRAFRADADGASPEAITSPSQSPFQLIQVAVAVSLKKVFCVYTSNEGYITVLDTVVPFVEIIIASSLDYPRAILIDERDGFFYVARRFGIDRMPLGDLTQTVSKTEVYQNEELKRLTGLSIDLTATPRRLFFCNYNDGRTFYKDVVWGPNGTPGEAVELTAIFPPEARQVNVVFYNGTLFTLQKNGSVTGVGILHDYQGPSPFYTLFWISNFTSPWGMHIMDVIP
ncbi:uncharacterized protein [Diadema setosum]|uniref:uncharacterized protein n=1 Tax=Diadema setosum TaxID=31175 RepID=UPI003B3A8DBE